MWKNTKYILITALIIRLLLAPFFASSDISVWYQVISDAVNNYGIYDLLHFPYPPLWGYILVFWGKLFVNVGGIAHIGQYVSSIEPVNAINNYIALNVISPWLNFVIKLPLVASDYAIAWIIYQIIKERSVRAAVISVAFWLLNPLPIFASYMLGQFDTIPALLMLIAFVFFWHNKKLLSGLALSVSVLFKFYPIFVLPVYIAVIIFRNDNVKTKIKNLIYYMAGFTCPITAVLLAMSKTNIWTEIFSRSKIAMPMGVNFWFYNFSNDLSQLLNSIPYFNAFASRASIIALLVLLIVIFYIYKLKGSIKSLLFGQLALFVALMAFLYQNSVPQYYSYILILLIIIFATERIFLSELIILSAVSTLFYFSTIPSILPAYLYPLAAYTRLISVDHLNNYLISIALGKPVGSSVAYNFVTINSGIGFAVMTTIIYKSIIQMRKDGRN
jgi:hypothetical protein